MTYNTGNTVPSNDPRDLDDNAEVFDELINSTDPSVPDRLGVQRKTWHQVEIDAQALVSPNVTSLSGLTLSSNKGLYATGAGALAMFDLTAQGRTFLGASTDAAQRSVIGAIALADTGAFSGSAAKITTARNIAATGDAAWSVSFDGSSNATAALTLAASGVSAGTYGSVTVNAKGLVTAASALTPIANGGTGSAATSMANLTLQNSWALAAGGRAAYRKLIDFVYLELRVTSGTATDGTVVATLPAGFRPPSQVIVPVSSPPNTALSTTIAGPRIQINADGTIVCQNCTNVLIQTTAIFSLT